MKRALTLSLAALAALAMVGCFKDVVEHTFFRTAIYEQTSTDGAFLRATDADTYAFRVDTTEWYIASWEDALARRITNKTTGEQLTEPYAIGTFNSSDEYQTSLKLTAPTQMMVIVNPTLRLYAYRQYKLPVNLEYVDTKLYMASWRPTHKMGGWTIVNRFYTPPTQDEDGQ